MQFASQVLTFPDQPRKLSSGATALFHYLNSLHCHLGEAFPKQSTLARKYKVSLKTINRRVAELRDSGYLKLVHRGPTSSLYLPVKQVPKFAPLRDQNDVAFDVAFDVAWGVVSIYESSNELKLNTPRETKKKTMLTEPSIFEEFWSIYVDSGKRLSETDKMHSCQRFLSLDYAAQVAAVAEARRVVREASNPKFIGNPTYMLRDRHWERVQKVKTLAEEDAEAGYYEPAPSQATPMSDEERAAWGRELREMGEEGKRYLAAQAQAKAKAEPLNTLDLDPRRPRTPEEHAALFAWLRETA